MLIIDIDDSVMFINYDNDDDDDDDDDKDDDEDVFITSTTIFTYLNILSLSFYVKHFL